MNKYMIGKKIGMTQLFDETGKVIPVTVVETTPNYVTQIKQRFRLPYRPAKRK